METINISNLTSLVYLNAFNSKFTTLNLNSNILLKELRIENGLFQEIDLSKLSRLNKLDTTKNPSLTCIQVADVAAANAQADWAKDATAFYNTSCR